MNEFVEFLKGLPLLDEPWFLPVAGGLALVEAAVFVAIKCKTPHWVRPTSQLSNAGTRAIRRLRNGQ